MNPDRLAGALCRLAPVDSDEVAREVVSWMKDTEYARLLSTSAPYPATYEEVREDLSGSSPGFYPFALRTLAKDELIGIAHLEVESWIHRTGFCVIGIGKRAFWDGGYGTDAVRTILRFGFDELGLYRITGATSGYNKRMAASAVKLGFTIEGQLREVQSREGQRVDRLVWSLLRPEWDRQQAALGDAKR